MKWMIASDIHGSAVYCERMLQAYEREKADRLLILGDILYHGPRNDLPEGYEPKKVIQMLNDMKNDLLCVRGNCDTEVDQMVLDFPIMADYCILHFDDALETAQAESGITIFATHGHKYHPQCLPPMKNGDILLNGHTHIPACDKIVIDNQNGNESKKEYMYLNPGSVAIPKDGSANSYIVYEKGVFTWKNLDVEEYMKWNIDSHF